MSFFTIHYAIIKRLCIWIQCRLGYWMFPSLLTRHWALISLWKNYGTARYDIQLICFFYARLVMNVTERHVSIFVLLWFFYRKDNTDLILHLHISHLNGICNIFIWLWLVSIPFKLYTFTWQSYNNKDSVEIECVKKD